MTKFILRYPGGESTIEARFINPKFLNGYWSYDKEGQKPYKQISTDENGIDRKQFARLGDTMYFQIKTIDFQKGDEISLQLMEQDFAWLFNDIDFCNPNDDKFPDKLVIIKTTVEGVDEGLTTIEVPLKNSWQKVIEDDKTFSLNGEIELYFKVGHVNENNYEFSDALPHDRKDFLLVREGEEQTLCYKPYEKDHNLPEMYTLEGEQIVLLQDVESKVLKSGRKAITKGSPVLAHRIAIGKLKKGYLAGDKGTVRKNATAKVYKYDTFSNDPDLYLEGSMIKDLERRKHVRFKEKGQWEHTNKVNQYDYFSKNGKRVTILGYLKQIGGIVDIFNVLSHGSMSQEEFMNSPLKFGGVLSPAFDIAGVMIQEIKEENNEYLTEALQQDLEEAKSKGLDAVKEFISIPNVESLIHYRVQPMYIETVQKMLSNEFTNFDDMVEYNNSNAEIGDTVKLLIKDISTEKDEITFIESIFYDVQ